MNPDELAELARKHNEIAGDHDQSSYDFRWGIPAPFGFANLVAPQQSDTSNYTPVEMPGGGNGAGQYCRLMSGLSGLSMCFYKCPDGTILSHPITSLGCLAGIPGGYGTRF